MLYIGITSCTFLHWTEMSNKNGRHENVLQYQSPCVHQCHEKDVGDYSQRFMETLFKLFISYFFC